MLHILSNPQSGSGRIRNVQHPYIEGEDVGAATLTFGSGVIATVEGTVNVPGDNLEEHLTLIGDTGVMKLGGTSANTVDYSYFENGGSAPLLREETANVYGNGHVSLFRDFAEAIEQGRDPYVTLEDGKNALAAILSIYRSSQTNAPVTALPEDFGTMSMKP